MSSSEVTPEQVLRIIDASLNRLGEGLRLLEDIARLQLDDKILTQHMKTMRHELLRGDMSFNRQLIQARNSAGDVGTDIEVSGEVKKRDLPTLVVANARRAQESLRTLEEVAKLPGTGLDPEKFKRTRFDLYTIEKNLLSRLLRQDKTKHIAGLYVIIDTGALEGRRHLEVTGQAIKGGVKVIQLRDKFSTSKELLPVARQLRGLCAEHNVLFIINDYLDIALAVDADGVHLGQDDLPVKEARRLLPIDKILGASVTTVEQTVAAEADGADYVAVSAIYPTSSKEAIEVVGLERLCQVRQVTSLPLVALGGINRDNAVEVMTAGADSVAVISAVMGAASPEEATRQIIDRLEAKK